MKFSLVGTELVHSFISDFRYRPRNTPHTYARLRILPPNHDPTLQDLVYYFGLSQTTDIQNRKESTMEERSICYFLETIKKKNCFRVGICRAAPHLPHIPVLYMSFLHVSPVPGNLCLPMEPRTNPEGSKMHILTCFVI